MFKLSFKTWYFKLACFQHQSFLKIILQTSVQQKKARKLDNVYYKHLIYSVGKWEFDSQIHYFDKSW